MRAASSGTEPLTATSSSTVSCGVVAVTRPARARVVVSSPSSSMTGCRTMGFVASCAKDSIWLCVKLDPWLSSDAV
jgi:hypothetical protein